MEALRVFIYDHCFIPQFSLVLITGTIEKLRALDYVISIIFESFVEIMVSNNNIIIV